MNNQNSGLGSMYRILRATNLLTTSRLPVREGMQRYAVTNLSSCIPMAWAGFM
jgi:hypothetical protein